jgi:tetratricopeptide (TPR) repeat protein
MDPGTAERIVEEEQMVSQFLADAEALDRLEGLSMQLEQRDPTSARTALIQAQVASATHRFADARRQLATAGGDGGLRQAVERLSLNIDQACGTRLDEVLGARHRIAAESNSLADLVPLGALLADLREFAEADQVYRRALQVYEDVSPFAVAWACFQLGVLWGELVPEPQLTRAADWYRRAIAYVPAYVKARVHLAEIHLRGGEAVVAEGQLTPAVASGDPEVHWRLSEAMEAQGRVSEAEAQLAEARSGFERLLEKHLLAFADHGAEFYAAGGNDVHRALELARINVANRSTQRAVEQAQAMASLVALHGESISNGARV